ncbi:MAG: hypothetical protein E5V62_19080 [Mesorhizobium sp.]|uniref:hypothetical protein n=1 Tax=Mesorhizobium sp. TaxID=1871066 RepID=UPI000FD2108A|nr:hypothetical protein [Mesorhizobium sp.]RVD73352.1 hypothetical protein EN751_05430 [Mesorhizobium sp. M4A.F.Ca.ET.029.04.2.1]TIW33775.1 MAG: hypothetical protein E5V62_19080 [Mesorhizobium sp.]
METAFDDLSHAVLQQRKAFHSALIAIVLASTVTMGLASYILAHSAKSSRVPSVMLSELAGPPTART